MAHTTITITTEARELIESLKRTGESCNDVLLRHLRPPTLTCGDLLKALEEEFEGVSLISPTRRAQLRAGRGRRSPRRHAPRH